MPIQIIADQIKNGEITNDKLANSTILPAKIDLSQVFGFTAIPTINQTPTAANQIVSKQYVDNKLQGLSWHDSVRVRSTSNVDISDAPATIDGISMAANDRVLLTAQSTGSENGIYVWASGGSAMTRATDADSFAELQSAAVFIREGTSADKGYLQSAELSSFASQNWIQFSSTNSGRQAGTALELASNTLNVKFDNSSIGTNGSGQLEIKASGIQDAMIAESTISNSRLANASITVNSGSGLSGGGATALGASVTLAAQAADSSITVGAGGIAVGQITAAKMAANSIQTGNIVDANVTLAKIEAIPAGKVILGNASNQPTATTISGDISISNSGVATIQAGAVDDAMLAGGIQNSRLQNSTVELTGGDGVSIASGAIALGGSKSVNLSLDGTSLVKSASGLKINDSGVGSAQIADDAILTAKLPDSAVTNSKLANASLSVVAGDGLQTTSASIALGGTSTVSIRLDGSSLALDASNGLSVAAGGIQTSMLAANSVNSAAIQNNAVGSSEIADDSIGSTELAANAVLIEKVGFRAYSESFTGTSNVKYDLSRAVNTNFFDRVQVFRNGLRCKKVASLPGSGDKSQYSVANDGTSSVCAVTFDAAPNGDLIIVDFLT